MIYVLLWHIQFAFLECMIKVLWNCMNKWTSKTYKAYKSKTVNILLWHVPTVTSSFLACGTVITEVLAQHHAVCTIGVNGRQRSANAFEEVWTPRRTGNRKNAWRGFLCRGRRGWAFGATVCGEETPPSSRRAKNRHSRAPFWERMRAPEPFAASKHRAIYWHLFRTRQHHTCPCNGIFADKPCTVLGTSRQSSVWQRCLFRPSWRSSRPALPTRTESTNRTPRPIGKQCSPRPRNVGKNIRSGSCKNPQRDPPAEVWDDESSRHPMLHAARGSRRCTHLQHGDWRLLVRRSNDSHFQWPVAPPNHGGSGPP